MRGDLDVARLVTIHALQAQVVFPIEILHAAAQIRQVDTSADRETAGSRMLLPDLKGLAALPSTIHKQGASRFSEGPLSHWPKSRDGASAPSTRFFPETLTHRKEPVLEEAELRAAPLRIGGFGWRRVRLIIAPFGQHRIRERRAT
jgi:hypothetical protein